MKKILFAIGFLLISTAELAAQSLSEIINQKETILVDVRTPEEFAQGNVKNSINIPISELENNLSKLEGKKNVVVFCKAGIRAAKAEKLLKDKKIKNVYNGKTWENVKSLVKTNLDNSENYNSEKPHFNILRDSEKVKQVAVSLGKNGVFKKHKTSTPASLVVLKGEIKFIINDQEIILKPNDYYDIPVDVEHELVGLSKENLFVVTKQK